MVPIVLSCCIAQTLECAGFKNDNIMFHSVEKSPHIVCFTLVVLWGKNDSGEVKAGDLRLNLS